MTEDKNKKAWGGRFQEETDRLMEEFNASIWFDRRLWREDIMGSVAYAEALSRAGIITEEEYRILRHGLETVGDEIENEKFEWRLEDEDIHMAVERRLTEIVGPVGGKLHTGRSRNDQVATDLRMWTINAVDTLIDYMEDLQRALLEKARVHVDTLMPGFTHLQQAQVVSFAHYLLSFFWMFQRDCSRFLDLSLRASSLPLGSGALAGHALDIDREFLAEELGFLHISPNSMDAVSDRDFVVEFLSNSALAMTHLSRLAEDLIIYSSVGYRYVTLSDRYTTGSSLMPQKKNPDSLELIRGKTGRLLGNLTGFLATLKGLPSTYNKDLQEDKEPLFDTFDNLALCLHVAIGVVETLTVNKETMTRSLDDFLLATDLADYLVKKGMPFRWSHEAAGKCVAMCEERGVGLKELPLEAYREVSDLFGADLKKVLSFKSSAARRKSFGGTAPSAVRKQLKLAELELD